MITTRRSERIRAWCEAAESLGLDPTPIRRPNPARWVWYAFWGGLPPRHASWVLYDATGSRWVLRHFVRLLTVAALPVALVIVLLPGPLHLRVLTALVAGLGGFLFAVVWINESTEHRLIRAGWRSDVGPELRTRRAEIQSWMASVRRL